MNYILFAILCSGIFYYLGGQGGPWYKQSWIRDWICSLLVISVLFQRRLGHPSLYLCYPLMIIATSAYHKYVNRWLKEPTNDAEWYNWFLHGLGIGFALIPYGIFIHNPGAVLCRAIILGISMAIWSHFIHKDWLDEGGRGSLIIATLYLF